MFRTFEVTTGKNPDRSGAFNGLAFLRGLLCCRIVPDPIWDKGKRVGRARIQVAPRLKDRKNDGSSFISPLGSLDLGRSRTTLA
jgi:hypothetical protein